MVDEAASAAAKAATVLMETKELTGADSLPYLLARIRAHARACEAVLEKGETEEDWYRALGHLTFLTALGIEAMAQHGWEDING